MNSFSLSFSESFKNKHKHSTVEQQTNLDLSQMFPFFLIFIIHQLLCHLEPRSGRSHPQVYRWTECGGISALNSFLHSLSVSTQGRPRVFIALYLSVALWVCSCSAPIRSCRSNQGQSRHGAVGEGRCEHLTFNTGGLQVSKTLSVSASSIMAEHQGTYSSQCVV